MYVSSRTQFASAASTYYESLPMRVRPYTTAPTDNVEVVVYATAPSVVVATIGGVQSSCSVGAGRSVCTFPLRVGTVAKVRANSEPWELSAAGAAAVERRSAEEATSILWGTGSSTVNTGAGGIISRGGGGGGAMGNEGASATTGGGGAIG